MVHVRFRPGHKGYHFRKNFTKLRVSFHCQRNIFSMTRPETVPHRQDSELRWAQLTCDVMKRGWNMSKPVETTCMLLYVAFSIQCTMTHPIFQLSMLRIVEPGRSYPVIPELTPLTSLTPSAPSCRKLSFWSFWSTDCWWPLETTHTLSFLCTSQLLRGLPNEATASLNWKFRDIAEWLDTTNTKKPLLNVKRFFGPKSVLQNLWVSFSNSQSSKNMYNECSFEHVDPCFAAFQLDPALGSDNLRVCTFKNQNS